jgi:hypothetical protein
MQKFDQISTAPHAVVARETNARIMCGVVSMPGRHVAQSTNLSMSRPTQI